jgi:hypothetical protein
MDDQPVCPGMAEARWPKDGDGIPDKKPGKQTKQEPLQ